MTPADRLRTAARLMRARAEAATPGPWEAAEGVSMGLGNPEFEVLGPVQRGNGSVSQAVVCGVWGEDQKTDAEHLASWHHRHAATRLALKQVGHGERHGGSKFARRRSRQAPSCPEATFLHR